MILYCVDVDARSLYRDLAPQRAPHPSQPHRRTPRSQGIQTFFYINFIIQKKGQTGPGSAAIDKLYRQIDNEPHSSLNLPFHHKVKGYKLFHKNFIIQTRPSIHSSEITDKKRRDTDRQMDNEPLSTSSYTTKSRYTNFIIKKQGKLPIAAK